MNEKLLIINQSVTDKLELLECSFREDTSKQIASLADSLTSFTKAAVRGMTLLSKPSWANLKINWSDAYWHMLKPPTPARLTARPPGPLVFFFLFVFLCLFSLVQFSLYVWYVCM